MSKTIYSIQEKLDSILDIEQTKYEYIDAELFDTSDYNNDGKITPWNKGFKGCFLPESIELMKQAKLGKKLKPETIEKMKKSSAKERPWRKGKTMPVASSEKKRQKMLEYWKNRRLNGKTDV